MLPGNYNPKTFALAAACAIAAATAVYIALPHEVKSLFETALSNFLSPFK